MHTAACMQPDSLLHLPFIQHELCLTDGLHDSLDTVLELGNHRSYP
jgi:hypothetical protein